MASNRYVSLAPFQYHSQYVPKPFEELAAIGQQQQKQADDALNQTYKLQDIMNSVHAIDEHQPYKQLLHDKYYQKIEDIANRITTKGDLTAQNDLNKIAREWQNDPLRNELETSYANYGLYQKDKIAKGEKYAEWHDPKILTGFTGTKNGQIESFRYTGMGEIQDHQKLARDMMASIGKDGYDYDSVGLDSSGNIVGKKGGKDYILSDKVKSLAELKAADFMQTNEGRDYAQMLAYKYPNATPEQLHKQVIKYLYDAGANQIFETTKSGNSFQYSPWAKDEHDEAKTHAQNLYTTAEKNTDPEYMLNKLKNDGVDNFITDLGLAMNGPKQIAEFYAVREKLTSLNKTNPDATKKLVTEFDNKFKQQLEQLEAKKQLISGQDVNTLSKKFMISNIDSTIDAINKYRSRLLDGVSVSNKINSAGYDNIVNNAKLSGLLNKDANIEETQKFVDNYLNSIRNKDLQQSYTLMTPKEQANFTQQYFGLTSKDGLGEGQLSGAFLSQTFVDPQTGTMISGKDLLEQIGTDSKHTVQIMGEGKGSNVYKSKDWQSSGLSSLGLKRVAIDGKEYWMEGSQEDKEKTELVSAITLSKTNFEGGIPVDESGKPIPVKQFPDGTKIYSKFNMGFGKKQDTYEILIQNPDGTFIEREGVTEDQILNNLSSLFK